MRFLALSDEVVDWIYGPGLAARAGQIDFVVSCGDLPMHYLEFVTSTLNVPSFYVRGNHDLYEVGDRGTIKTEPEGWINLDSRRVACRGVTLAGLEGCARYKPGVPLQYSQREQRLRALWLMRTMLLAALRGRRGVDILVTHAPPFGIHDAADPAHIGFHAHEWLIRAARPRYLLHGHQHRNYAPLRSHETQVGDTLVINAHPARVLEI